MSLMVVSCAGKRIPTSSDPEVSISGTLSFLLRTTVTGPGRNFLIKYLSFSSIYTRSSIILRSETATETGLYLSRFLLRTLFQARYLRKYLPRYHIRFQLDRCCLLYTSDAADDLLCVDLGGRRIIKKK